MENTFDLRKFLVENKLTYNSRLVEGQQLTPEEQKAVDYVLGLDEGVVGDIVSRAKEIARKGLLKGAVLATLLATPNIAQAQKTQIQQIASTTTTTAPTQKATPAAATYVASPKTVVPGTIKTVNFTQTFASGEVYLTNKDALVKEMGELQAFLKGKDASKFRVVIVAGESQVTNPKGYETKGSLAQARAKAVENEIKGLKFSNIDIKTEIGTTTYQPGNNIDDPKYQAEQFVTINIIANNDICSMPDVDRNEGQGVATNNYVTYDDYISGVGELILDTGTIPDRMVVLDANGNIKQDTGYITTKTSKYKDWKYTPAHVLALTNAYIAGNVSMKGIDPKTVITVTDYDDLVKQISNTTKPGVIGDEIGPALNQMKKMILNGQKEFVIYNLGTSVAKLKFDQNKGEVQAKVYSPVGKTGYNIKGNCR
jgi:hypothetical protein